MDGYSNIYGPDNFSDEFCKYVLNMTPEQVFHADEIPKAAKRYVKWLQRSLTQLDSLGTATTALKNFEKTARDGRYLLSTVSKQSEESQNPLFLHSRSKHCFVVSFSRKELRRLSARHPCSHNKKDSFPSTMAFG